MMIVARNLSPNARAFLVIWIGQFVSLIGSRMTSFALGVYLFQQTGQTTSLVVMWAISAVPSMLIAPFAGSMTDRINRKTIMLVSDILAAMVTVLLIAILMTSTLSDWHIYLSVVLTASFGLFQSLAYEASIPLLVPASFLPRANGLVQIAAAASGVATPVFAGFLYSVVGLQGIIVLDLGTFLFATTLLLFISVPDVPRTEAENTPSSVWADFLAGWRFIRARGSLFTLLVFASIINVIAVSETLVTPLVLSFSTEESLGLVLGIGGMGLIAGSLYMSITGGPRRLIVGVIGFELITGTSTVVMGLTTSIPVITAAVFSLFFAYPVIEASVQSLWQRKTPTDIQGRVFATRRMFSWTAIPFTFLLAGPLVDQVLNPALLVDGALADSVGSLIGIGPGRGISLMMIITGALNVLAAILAWTLTRLPYIDVDLPDVTSA